jgi:hypothetical protein
MKPDLSKRNHDNIKRLSLSFTIPTNKMSTLCLQKENTCTFINVVHFIVEKRGPTVEGMHFFFFYFSLHVTQPSQPAQCSRHLKFIFSFLGLDCTLTTHTKWNKSEVNLKLSRKRFFILFFLSSFFLPLLKYLFNSF